MVKKQKNKKNIVAFVELAPKQAIDTVKKNLPGSKILILRDIKHQATDTHENLHTDFLEHIDFTSTHKIATALRPYHDTLLAITARGESGASRLSEVVPQVPYLRTPTSDSLRWSTDKYEMRKRFKLFDSKITPKFTKVKDISAEESERVINKIGFPLIIKPANLEESKLVTKCYFREEYDKAIKNIFKRLKIEYSKLNRLQSPTVIAEQYMEGDMYTIDSYVDSRGKVWHCPLVKIKTGKDVGYDDFFNYLQITPSGLGIETVYKAREVAETAIHALGLRSVTAHIELMKIDSSWKVIEVGPRIGGFRPLLYELSCGIDHSLNDVYVRIPKTPIIPKKCQGHACAMKFFAKKEGTLVSILGLKKIQSLASYHSIVTNKKVGDKAVFAKNGGKSVFNLFLYNPDRSKLLADIRRVEQMVQIKVV
jgi:biotin carboxylase